MLTILTVFASSFFAPYEPVSDLGLVQEIPSGWQQLKENFDQLEPMTASWYGYELEGHTKANGQPFDPEGLTAAHPTLPLGTRVWLYNPTTRRSVALEITDRGPFVPGRDIDISRAAAQKLGMLKQGVAELLGLVL